MPRVYVRKRETKYSLQDLQNAVKDVEANKKTYRQAADTYNVPISVIYHRLKGRKVDINRMGAGVSRVLPNRVEDHIVSCLKTRAQMGHPVIKTELKNLVKEYVESNSIVNNFKDNTPGEDWYINFMKRHPELSLKKPEHLQKSRVDARKPYIVYDFYKMLQDIVKEKNLEDKPMYIFNCDESGFQSDPSKLRAIGHKGKALYRVSGGSGRESTTVLACVSADGKVLPPVIIFKGAAVQARWTSDKSYPGTLYAASKNGWMEESIFFNWLKKCFISYVTALRDERNEQNQTALLLYDGHSSHISIRIIEEADKANIILMKFPSHLTDSIQPLDKCVFGPVKKAWEKKLVEHGVQQMGKGTGRLPRAQFGELLGQVYTEAFRPQNIISGFVTTGLHPVDPFKFPKKFFNTKDLELYSILLHNEMNNTIDVNNINEEEWQEELFQLDLRRLNQTQVIGSAIDGEISQEAETETINQDAIEIPQFEQEIEIQRKTQEELFQLDLRRLNQTQVIGSAIDGEISQEAETETINQDAIEIPQFEQEIEIQRKTVTEITNQDAIDTQFRDFNEQNIETEINREKKQHITTNSKSILSSALLNNILKQISLDSQTDINTKTQIVNAILSTLNNNEESILEETKSPNKEALQKIFGVSSTPEKKKKIVIPRLKQCAFGEVLTTKEVKERLKEAEDKKQKKKSQTQKKCKSTQKENKEPTIKKQRKRKGNEGKKNTKTKTIKVTNKRRKFDSEDSSNSEIDMSIHSDSDIAEVASNQTSFGSPHTLPSIENELILNVHDSPVSPIAGCSRSNDETDVAVHVEYQENDTVLVRYVGKKKVEYFVGKVTTKTRNGMYTISFFKKVGRNDNTKFIVTTNDIDTVAATMIVKTVNLLSLNDKETEFIFMDDEDYFYFD